MKPILLLTYRAVHACEAHPAADIQGSAALPVDFGVSQGASPEALKLMNYERDMLSSCCADFVMGCHFVFPVADGEHGLLDVPLIAADFAAQSSWLPVVHLLCSP